MCYLTLNMGSEEAPAAPISITINSNTRVDILLDTAKTILLQSVTKLLATPQPLPLPAAPVVEPVEERSLQQRTQIQLRPWIQ